jgi:hypothetical protein
MRVTCHCTCCISTQFLRQRLTSASSLTPQFDVYFAVQKNVSGASAPHSESPSVFIGRYRGKPAFHLDLDGCFKVPEYRKSRRDAFSAPCQVRCGQGLRKSLKSKVQGCAHPASPASCPSYKYCQERNMRRTPSLIWITGIFRRRDGSALSSQP